MVKINRTSEYGLIALRYMQNKAATQNAQEVTSAREIADTFGLPFEITAKTLQRLKDSGLIQSAQGAKGGYTLLKALSEISLADFLSLMEGPQSMVACSPSHSRSGKVASGSADSSVASAESKCQCEYQVRCEIKDIMADLNSRLYGFLSGIRLAEITSVKSVQDGLKEGIR